MASAVFEAAEDDRYAEVEITVLPGVTAAQPLQPALAHHLAAITRWSHCRTGSSPGR